jgi:hypothetical protein
MLTRSGVSESAPTNLERPAPALRGLAPLALFFGTLFLRALLLGNPPFSDEGFYAYHGEMGHRGAGSIPGGPIHLYASLVRLVGMSPATPFLRFRVVDAFVAAGAAAMFYFFLTRWTNRLIAFVIATGWTIASNLPLFVDAGFRNPILAATMVYMSALCVLSFRSRSAPFWAGLIIPFAFFLREPFLPILIVSLYLAAGLHGRSGILLHIAGLAVTGVAFLAWIWVYRGGLGAVLEQFSDLSMHYRALPRLGRNIAAERWLWFKISARATMWILPPAALGAGWVAFGRREDRLAKGLAVLLFVPHLPEIFGKVCLPYHWAELLVGLAFMGAMGLHWVATLELGPAGRLVQVTTYIIVAGLVGELDARVTAQAYRAGFALSREFAPVMIWGETDHAAVDRSLYLQAAKLIRERTGRADRIVISANYNVLNILADRRPPSPFTADLTLMDTSEYPRRHPELIEELRRIPPRMVIETMNYPVHLRDYWPDFDKRYHLARAFPRNDSQHFGNNALRIWELNE